MQVTSLTDLAVRPEIRQLLLDHARLGLRVQSVVRICLALIIMGAVVVEPPTRHGTVCDVVAALYVAGALAFATLSSRRETVLRTVWLVLFVDLAVVTALSLISSGSVTTWTSDILVFAFFLLPVLGATQLRPWICSAVCAPTVGLYFLVGAVTRIANGDEPWRSITLRTLVLATASLGAVMLSRVQRSRVLAVGRLALDRSTLVTELVQLEDRERRDLSEALHDGALQYVLAARMDLEDVESAINSETYVRLDEALATSAKLLRSTVYELHPAVLAQSGLRPALSELTRNAGARGGFTVYLQDSGWPAGARTDADTVLYATARELLNNVVKHAGASTVWVGLDRVGDEARITISDDGRGFSELEMEKKLAEGHIGLSSRRARVEAAGGRLEVKAREPKGTVVDVHVPARLSPGS